MQEQMVKDGLEEAALDRVIPPLQSNSSQMGSCQITYMRLWPVADYEPYHERVPLTKFDGGLHLLQEAEDDAVKWLESIATMAFVK